ncbi:hypothetical protein ABZV60_24190 [Streptomyces sp. NPDC004787]|uniref:hypothetical protein n=1 Tax=Streptomyces sp. NPDC004787 TaxID=3154291 RepID=UPI0033AB4684
MDAHGDRPARRGNGARRAPALLVPALALAAAALLAARIAFDSDTFQHCRYLGPSLRMHVTSWAGLACAVAALLTYARQRTRAGGAPAPGRPLASAAALLTLPVLALLALSVYWLHAPDPSGGHDCSGLLPLLPGPRT